MRMRASGFLPVVLAALAACGEGTTVAPTTEAPTILTAQGSRPTKGHPGSKIVESMPAPNPWGVAVRDDGLTLFTDLNGGRVGISNTFTRVITGYIPTGAYPTGIAFSPDGSRAYTANQGIIEPGTVTVIDANAGQAIASVPIADGAPFSVQVSDDGARLYVGNNNNTMSVVDIATLQVVQTIVVGQATNAFAVNPAGTRMYASHFVSGTVSEIEVPTGNLLRTFTLGGRTQGLALNRKGTRLYVANENAYLSEIDLASGVAAAPIPIAGVGFGVGVTPDDNQAWITLPLAGKVQIFNLTQRKIIGTLQVGGEPRRVAFSSQGKLGAITDPQGSITFVR
jgi:YVTN family beta-propeller protein/YD repeat-containing protein